MIKNKKGVTLIELLIVLSILSIIISLAFSVIFVGTKNFSVQTANVNNQSNVRYALNIISRDIRKAESVTVSEHTITIDDSFEYKLENNELLKGEQILATDVETFHITKVGNKITIEINSLPNSVGQSVSLSSTIYIRK